MSIGLVYYDMIIQLNGKNKEISSDTTIAGLLDELKLVPASVVIELNQTILRPEDLTDCSLKEGDTLELIRFVGGG